MPKHHHSILLTPKQRALLAGHILLQDAGRRHVTFPEVARLTGLSVSTIKSFFPVAGLDEMHFTVLHTQYFDPVLASIPSEPSLYVFTDILRMLETRRYLLSNIGTALASAATERHRSAYLNEAIQTQRQAYLDRFGMYCLACRMQDRLAPQYALMGPEALARALDRNLFGPLVAAAMECPEELGQIDLEALALSVLFGSAADPIRGDQRHTTGHCRSRGTTTTGRTSFTTSHWSAHVKGVTRTHRV